MKQCNCLIQLDIPEYLTRPAQAETTRDHGLDETDDTNEITTTQTVPNQEQSSSSSSSSQQSQRQHIYFQGNTLGERRKTVEKSVKYVRSFYKVHLIIPGRNQKGPIAFIGQTYHETIPAIDYLLTKQLRMPTTSTANTNNIINGRIQCNVKDPHGQIWEGIFRIKQSHHHQQQKQQQPQESSSNENSNNRLQPYWVFESDTWTVMACELSSSTRTSNDTTNDNSNILQRLQVCIDNIKFQMGNEILREIDIFFSGTAVAYYATGPPSHVRIVFDEI
jgi:hypothetical protein